MDKEQLHILESKISKIVKDTIHEEFRKCMRLDEMSRIGRMNNYEVIVYTDDMGYIPHVHIIDSATRGQEFDTCVQLETNKYFLHGRHQDTFNNKLCKMFNDFMHEPHRNVHFRNNYEYAVNMWNDNNSNSYVQLHEDDNGDIMIPDYSTITL